MDQKNNVCQLKMPFIIVIGFLAIGLLVISFLAGARVVSAKRASEKNDSVTKIPITLVGVVQKVTSDNLLLLIIDSDGSGGHNTKGIKEKVQITKNTLYSGAVLNEGGVLVPKKIHAADIKKDDSVTVEAFICLDNVLKLVARNVMVSPDKKTLESASFESPTKNGRAIYGFASDVSAGGFLLTDPDGKATRVLIDKDTNIVAGGSANSRPRPATYAAVVDGAKISLFGKILEDGSIKATNIAVAK